jgi:stearoyl-CoA desaturase (delta-9 desaturase)
MSPVHRMLNLAGVLVPFAGFVAAIVLLWHTELVGWTDLALFAAMYVLTAYGVTLGFHRLLTHRSFATHAWLEYALAILGSMAVQGPVIQWVADHRKHHAHTDREGDPHSPHGHGPGLRAALGGLWYAHMGWLLDRESQAEHRRYARDLFEDAGMQRINRLFGVWVLIGVAIPFAVGYAVDGTLGGALAAAVWGGAVRVFMLHHVTWSINSICHFFGRRRFDVDDRSTNVFWLAPFSLGESWHHNHHAFPRSASHGLRWWEVDPTAWAIRALRRLGLVWNVVEISPERQQQKLALTRAQTGINPQ